ncbi:MAG TPA: PASTA domain-containing protein [Tenuifilaceae bacterium]|nr:PASTA domain-containing protein [Tenuifilaceae bacterium]HRX31067.1 PASTA domain-containing protein [Tenuifilaceae bacterium]
MEKVKHTLKIFFNNPITRTILYGLGGGILILVFLMLFLNIFTRHGNTYAIPDFRNVYVDDLPKLVEKAGLRLVINDSVYIINKAPGIVIDQNPAPGKHVKKNRKVFITINAKSPIKVPVPDLEGNTLRQAKAILEQDGFEIGRLSFRPDLGVNIVLDQQFQGTHIDQGTMIPKGSKIDLLLGMGMHGERTGLPLLIGLKLNESQNRIIEASLNVGRIRFDETISTFKDSLDAMVYSQYPAYTENLSMAFGTRVDIWLTLNQSRIPKIEQEKKDTVNTENISADEIFE